MALLSAKGKPGTGRAHLTGNGLDAFLADWKRTGETIW